MTGEAFWTIAAAMRCIELASALAGPNEPKTFFDDSVPVNSQPLSGRGCDTVKVVHQRCS
jgi:hypothetical protein